MQIKSRFFVVIIAACEKTLLKNSTNKPIKRQLKIFYLISSHIIFSHYFHDKNGIFLDLSA